MEINRGIEPRLVEVDNLGEANSSPSPYTLLWWLKKILEALDVDPVDYVSVDVRSAGFIDIDSSGYTDIVTLPLVENESFVLEEVFLSLQGFSAEFILEYFNGSTTENVRMYVINTQQSTFSEASIKNVVLPYVGAGSSLKIKAKMHSVNQEGKAYAVLNGYKRV